MKLLLFRYLLLGFVLFYYELSLSAQNSFITAIASSKDETPGKFIQNGEGEFIGIVYITNPITLSDESYIFKLDEYGDTICSRKIALPGKSIFIQNIVEVSTSPSEYMITGWERSLETYFDTLTYISKLDSNFQPIWENLYDLIPDGVNAYAEYYQNLLQKPDSGYLFATNYDNPGDHKLVLFEFSEQGESLSRVVFEGDSAGYVLWSLSYNHDSTLYFLYTYRAHFIQLEGTCQRITLDLNLNQTDVHYYPRWLRSLSPCIASNGSLITGGLYENMEPPKYSNMAAFKHDQDFNLIGECYIADPDYEYRKDNGRISLDSYHSDAVFLAGTFDWDVGIWVNHPSWIVVGKLDSNLNLIKETYVGGDAFYHFHTVVATNDGGVFMSASRYDYLTQNQERDAYLIKLDSIDVSVNIIEINDETATVNVYPNPADEYVIIDAEEDDYTFILFDFSGKMVLQSRIRNCKTKISVTEIPSGIYFWSIQSNNRIIDKGKLIIK
jgi:hypothetical protein